MYDQPTWHLEKRRIKDLKPYHKNPRQLSKHDEAHLTVSLDKFGIIDKPFINTDGTIIGGHQRIKVLSKLEHDEIEVQVPNRTLTEPEVEELNIRHNRNAGEWDYDILANEFDLEDLFDWGFTDKELALDMNNLGSDSEEKEESKKCPTCKQRIKE